MTHFHNSYIKSNGNMKKKPCKTNLIVDGMNGKFRTRTMSLAALFYLAFSTEIYAETPILSSMGYVGSSKQITQQNQKQIKGIVKDMKGEPIVGVNIIVKGTTIGTTTDLDGRFSLEVPIDGVLKISFIGYKGQEIPIAGKNDFSKPGDI